MIKHFVFFFYFLPLNIFAQFSNSSEFNEVYFNKAVIYVIDTSIVNVTKHNVVINGQLNPEFKIKRELSDREIRKFLKAINKRSTYGNPPLSCSTKEVGVIFYDEDKLVKYVTISFECDYLTSSHSIPANENQKFKYEDGTVLYSCFSTRGRKRLLQFF